MDFFRKMYKKMGSESETVSDPISGGILAPFWTHSGSEIVQNGFRRASESSLDFRTILGSILEVYAGSCPVNFRLGLRQGRGPSDLFGLFLKCSACCLNTLCTPWTGGGGLKGFAPCRRPSPDDVKPCLLIFLELVLFSIRFATQISHQNYI